MSYAEGKLGPLSGMVLARPGDGTGVLEERFTTEGAQYVTDLLPRYAELCRRGNVYFAANQAGQAITVLGTVLTGLVISNPVGSGKILIPLLVSLGLSAAPAAATVIGWGVAPAASATDVTHTTPLIVRPALIGNKNGASGLVDSSATVPTAIVAGKPIGAITGAAALAPATMESELGGLFAMLPGTYAGLFSLTAASALAAILWAELPA